MKYNCDIIIDLPIDKTVSLWSNEKHYAKWQDGFQSIKHLSDHPKKKGAVAIIQFTGKQSFELKETILVNDLPNEKKGLYEHQHMINTQTTRFIALGPSQTKYISEVEYTQFNGIMIKLFAKLFPGKFKGQSQKWMEQFKAFAEEWNEE